MKNPAPNANCASVQAELKAHRDGLGKVTKPVHYKNEIGLMRFALTGDCNTKCNFADPPPERSRVTRQVVCLNRRLIRRNVSFGNRKQACRDFVVKQQAKEMQQSRLNTSSNSPITKSLGTENDQ